MTKFSPEVILILYQRKTFALSVSCANAYSPIAGQKNFWNAIGRKPGNVPELYYTNILQQKNYLSKITRICGAAFFN